MLLLDLSLKFAYALPLALYLNHKIIIRQLLHDVLQRLVIKGLLQSLQNILTLSEIFEELVLQS